VSPDHGDFSLCPTIHAGNLPETKKRRFAGGSQNVKSKAAENMDRIVFCGFFLQAACFCARGHSGLFIFEMMFQ
jgi:hypothetical protein